MTRPTKTTRRRLPKLHVGRKPGDQIGIAGGGRSAVFAKPGGRIERIGVRVGPVGLEVALERRQVIGGLGGAIKKDHDKEDRTGTRIGPMTKPTKTTRMEGNRTAESVEVGRKPGDQIGIAGGGRSAVFAKPGGRIERIGVRVGPVGLEVALERRQVIGGLGGAIKKDHDKEDRTGTRSWISSSEEENF
ncbi:hypothetical protein BY996DRAFT_8391931 [Phakopsora pachyrhizi]|nr:hypothetical protein BY996DRAFT_8391931 [Phakopsora pachyrhizi]